MPPEIGSALTRRCLIGCQSSGSGISRIGKRNFDLRFWREGELTRWEVLRGDTERVVAQDYARNLYHEARN